MSISSNEPQWVGRLWSCVRCGTMSVTWCTGREPFIEILVVALDSDCDAAGKRRDALRAADGFAGKIVLAIPEPHVERWFLLDPQAPARHGRRRRCSSPRHEVRTESLQAGPARCFRGDGGGSSCRRCSLWRRDSGHHESGACVPTRRFLRVPRRPPWRTQAREERAVKSIGNHS